MKLDIWDFTQSNPEGGEIKEKNYNKISHELLTVQYG